MRAATLNSRYVLFYETISIHAAHAGSDATGVVTNLNMFISIHAAHAGSDQEHHTCQ